MRRLWAAHRVNRHPGRPGQRHVLTLRLPDRRGRTYDGDIHSTGGLTSSLRNADADSSGNGVATGHPKH